MHLSFQPLPDETVTVSTDMLDATEFYSVTAILKVRIDGASVDLFFKNVESLDAMMLNLESLRREYISATFAEGFYESDTEIPESHPEGVEPINIGEDFS